MRSFSSIINQILMLIHDSSLSTHSGVDFNLTANYNGFNTTMYNRQGCRSSTCEGVAILKTLHVSAFKS